MIIIGPKKGEFGYRSHLNTEHHGKSEKFKLLLVISLDYHEMLAKIIYNNKTGLPLNVFRMFKCKFFSYL